MPFVVKVTGAKQGMQADLKGAYRTAASAVEARAKVEAPRRSGRLAGSVKAKGSTTGASIVAGGLKAVPYAGPIHYGWPSRPNKARGWRGGPIKANPFLTRAANGSVDVVRGLLEQELQRVLNKVMPDG